MTGMNSLCKLCIQIIQPENEEVNVEEMERNGLL
jgi:hypothetical protein